VTETTQTRTPDSRPTGGLSAQYQPGEVEQRRYEAWVSAGYFTADPASDKPAFSIVIPPPNVTGSLHVGHALDHTIQDILSRLKRMQGYEVLWLPGMDHAGIATQNVVERQLAAQQQSRHDLGRRGQRGVLLGDDLPAGVGQHAAARHGHREQARQQAHPDA